VIDTPHGQMLKVTSSTSLYLKAQKKLSNPEYGDNGYLEYSTLENRSESNGDTQYIVGEVWIGVTNLNSNITLKITLGHKNYLGTSPVVDEVNARIGDLWEMHNIERTVAMEPTV